MEHSKLSNKFFWLNPLLFISLPMLLICISSTAVISDSNLELQDGWIDCGGPSWYLNATTRQESSALLQSGPIENTGASRICRIADGPAKISFWWKTDANNYDEIAQLNFFVNGERVYSYDSGKGKYEFYELRYNGQYILTWEFLKYRSYPQNYGAGYIRNINIISMSKGNEDLRTVDTNNSTSSSRSKATSAQTLNHRDLFVKDKGNSIDTFSTISEAINEAKDGDSILISIKRCEETIELYKSLKLIGEDRNGSIIHGNSSKNSVIYIKAKDVTIQNLTIENGTRGVHVDASSGLKLIDCNINNCTKGGVWLNDVVSGLIQGNDFRACGVKPNKYIFLQDSNHTNILNNKLNSNDILGIELNNSNNSLIADNKITRLHTPITLSKNSGNNTIDSSNRITNCTLNCIFEYQTLWREPTEGKNHYGNWTLCHGN